MKTSPSAPANLNIPCLDLEHFHFHFHLLGFMLLYCKASSQISDVTDLGYDRAARSSSIPRQTDRLRQHVPMPFPPVFQIPSSGNRALARDWSGLVQPPRASLDHIRDTRTASPFELRTDHLSTSIYKMHAPTLYSQIAISIGPSGNARLNRVHIVCTG